MAHLLHQLLPTKSCLPSHHHSHSTNLWPSSIGCYESHCSRFVEYCHGKHPNVFEVNSCIFSKFMLHLFENEGYAPSTMISHWTSIVSILQHWNYAPANDSHIRALLNNFQLARPLQQKLMPQWDLHLVLAALLRPLLDGASNTPSGDVIRLKWWMLTTKQYFSFVEMLSWIS